MQFAEGCAVSTKLLDERIVPILPSVAVQLGLNEAIVIQQLHYMLQRQDTEERDGRPARRMTYEDWVRELPWWSESTIRRVIDGLRQSGLVVTARSKDSSWFSIDYVRLDIKLGTVNRSQVRSQAAEPGAQVEQHPCIEEGEEEGEELQPGSGRLFGGGEEAEQVQREEAEVQGVWDYYFAIFGDKLRVKGLTSARAGMIRKGLAAVGGDADVLKRAFQGLKSYRERYPDRSQDTAIDVVLKTKPGGSNLTDQIEFWAGQAPDGTITVVHLSDFARREILHRKAAVTEMFVRKMEHDNNSPYYTQGHQAIQWLMEKYGIDYDVEPDGRVVWSEPTKKPGDRREDAAQ